MLLGERRRRETERRPETALRISLDAVIFLDGELVGPDKSDLKGQFAAEFGARQALYKVILAKPVAGVEHFLDDQRNRERRGLPRTVPGPPRGDSPVDRSAIRRQTTLPHALAPTSVSRID